MGTVFLTDLARIAGRTRDTVRNMQNRDGTPWDDAEFADHPRRRYGVRHALALILCEMLEAQRINTSDAAEFVRAQPFAVDKFFADLSGGDTVARFVVAAYLADEIDGHMTWTKVFLAGYGTAEEVSALFAGELERTGRETTRERLGDTVTVRRVGGPLVAVASIPEAFRILTGRAAKAGFAVQGDGFMRLSGTPSDEEGDRDA